MSAWTLDRRCDHRSGHTLSARPIGPSEALRRIAALHGFSVPPENAVSRSSPQQSARHCLGTLCSQEKARAHPMQTPQPTPDARSASDALASVRQHSLGGAWRLRDIVAACSVFAAGAALTVLAYAASVNESCFREQQSFEWRAARIASSMESAFAQPLEILHSVPALFHASGEVERHEFAQFTRSALSRAPDVYAIEWFPLVRASERQAVVERARSDGLANFEFRKVGPDGKLVVVGRQAEHLPLFFMAPPNETALGLDLAAHSDRVAPAQRARDLGHAVSSPRLRLVEDPADVHSVAFFDPVYASPVPPESLKERRASFLGVAAVVFRLAPLVERAVHHAELGETDVTLVDEQGPANLRVLYESRPGIALELAFGAAIPEKPQAWNPSVFAKLPRQLLWSRSFRVADRPWRVLMRAPLAPPWRDRSGILLGGLGLSALLAFALFASRALARLRKQMHAALSLGQYTVTGELGRGGMGVVYEAQHAMLRRRTALKLIHDSGDALRLKRFEREAQLTSRLTHPNTISVYDYGSTPDGLLYYAMEYIEGVTFDALVRQSGPLPAARVIRLLEQVCGALHEAHGVGLIHRDIKPANLMLTCRGAIPDFVKVLDFGLVKESKVDANASADLTQSRMLVGTPHYMCPEGITSGVVDLRGDIYSLGAVGYFLLTGTEVFRGATVLAVCSDHLITPPQAPSSRLGKPLPPDLEAIVLRCLAKAPQDRPQSAHELREALLGCDIPERWTEADANQWWAEHGRKLLPTLEKSSANASTVEQTVVVDCRDRVDAARPHPDADVIVPSVRRGSTARSGAG